MSNIQFTTDAEWHALRAKHVGSSDIACLLGLSKFKTRWQLFMERTGAIPQLDLDDISHIRNGKYFEPAIAQIGAESYGVKYRKVRRYIEADDCPDLGVSLDYEEIAAGYPPIEIKWSVFGQGWEYDGLTVTEAPEQYLIQVQAQLACNPRAPYARLWGFIQGEVRQMIIEPRPAIIEVIKSTAREFMDSVRAGIEPPVDFALDGEALSRLANARALVSLDWTDDPEAQRLVERHLKAGRLLKKVESLKDAAKNELLKRMIDGAKDAEKDDAKIVAKTAAGKIAVATVAANPGTVVDETMLGSIINARKGYRRMTISAVKESKDE